MAKIPTMDRDTKKVKVKYAFEQNYELQQCSANSLKNAKVAKLQLMGQGKQSVKG